jgi:alanine-glyoxylate transaminase/serine-glyoxylate transaminase/serine-pyruvate transaminase
MVHGLRAALDMLLEEGIEAVHARHRRLAEAVRRAVASWAEAGAIAFQTCLPEARSETVTALTFAAGHDPDALKAYARDRLSVCLGGGLPPFQGRMLRIGHMGDLNEAMILGALGALETALRIHRVPVGPGALDAAIAWLAETAPA